MEIEKKEKRGRKKGSKGIKIKYHVEFCDLLHGDPKWITFDCSTQYEISNKLQQDYQVNISRDIIQNIILNRFNKKSNYPYLKVTVMTN